MNLWRGMRKKILNAKQRYYDSGISFSCNNKNTDTIISGSARAKKKKLVVESLENCFGLSGLSGGNGGAYLFSCALVFKNCPFFSGWIKLTRLCVGCVCVSVLWLVGWLFFFLRCIIIRLRWKLLQISRRKCMLKIALTTNVHTFTRARALR